MEVFRFSNVGCFIYALTTDKNLFQLFLLQQKKENPGLLSDKYVFSTSEKMTNDFDQMKSEVGNIHNKLESFITTRQEETQHQGQSLRQL